MDIDSDQAEDTEEPEPQTKTFIPGIDGLANGEVLQADESTYVMRHQLSLRLCCFSFDILRDNLGEGRQRLPASAYILAGTQEVDPQDNKILVAKLSSLHRTQTYGSFPS